MRDKTLAPLILHQRYSSLAGSHLGLALVAIARSKWTEAISLLRQSIETKLHIFPLSEPEAGHFQSVLLAFVTMDQALITRMVDSYRWEKGVAESVYLGRIIKSLALGDIDSAKAALMQRRPSIEAMFRGYPECLQAIADKNEPAFQIALAVACKSWRKWVSRAMKGLPDSVCFLQGVGLVRLAERVLERPIMATYESVPSEPLRC